MEGEQRIPTNLRNLLIIETLVESGGPMTAAELGRHVGLPKQTAHRLCNVLIREGFLTREPDGKRLRPGRRLRSVGSGVLHASWSHMARRQILKGIAAEVGETVNLVAPSVSGMRYVDRVETDWPIRVQLPIGTEVPIHCTASGKAFLGSLPDQARKTLVGSLTLAKYTPNSHTDRKALLDDAMRSADRGYALDEEEFIMGMNAVAVPVTDGQGRYVASLAIHGPKPRLSTESAIARVDIIRAGAVALRNALFS